MSVTNYYLPLDSKAQSTDLKTEEEYYSVFEEESIHYYVGNDDLNPRIMNAGNVNVGGTYSFIFEDWMVRDYGSNIFEVKEICGKDIIVEMLEVNSKLGFTEEELERNPELKIIRLSSETYWINNSKCWCAYAVDDGEDDWASVEEDVNMSTEKNEDSVNHPSHYAGEIECKDAMIQQFGVEKYRIFCQLNAFKYLWRSDMKHDTPDEDLAKAGWYLAEYEALSGDTSVTAQEAQEGTSNTSDEEVSIKVNEPLLGHFRDLYSGPGEYKAYTQSELYKEMDNDPYLQFICKETEEIYGRLCSFISNDKETIYDFKYNTYWKIEKDDLDDPDEDGNEYYILKPVGSNRTCEKWRLTPEYARTIMVRECRNV